MTPFEIRVGTDRATAYDEASALTAARTLRDDRYNGLQGSSRTPVEIYYHGRLVLTIPTTGSI